MSQFLTETILFFEKTESNEFSPFKKEIHEHFYTPFSNLTEEIKDNYERFFMDLFYELEDKIQDFPAISRLKTPWEEERNLIDSQYNKLIKSDYDKQFSNNSIFLSKIEDLNRIIRPDSEFSLSVERKELWILQEDYELNPSIEAESDHTVESIIEGKDPSKPTEDITSEKVIFIFDPGLINYTKD